jgi:hypothetical protein
MANKRTVDPTASEASAHIIGLRVTPSQLEQIAFLCKQRNTKRSQLFRDLIRQELEAELAK